MGRVSLITGLVILLTVGSSSITEPHAIIVESSPKADEVVTESPSRLTLRFNSRIVHSLSRTTLLGPNRRRISIPGVVPAPDRPDPARLTFVLPPLLPGKYRVEWRVLAEDGHVTEGGFFFHYPTTVGGRQEPSRPR